MRKKQILRKISSNIKHEDEKEKKLLLELKKVSDFRVYKHKIKYPLYEIVSFSIENHRKQNF